MLAVHSVVFHIDGSLNLFPGQAGSADEFSEVPTRLAPALAYRQQ
jgi:hypothetical protein